MCLLCIVTVLLIRSSIDPTSVAYSFAVLYSLNVNLSKTNFGQFLKRGLHLTNRIVHTHPRGFGKIMKILNLYTSVFSGQHPLVKTSCTGHRWRKTKHLFVSCSVKNLLGIVSWFLFFCFMSFVSGRRSQFPATVRPATKQNYYALDVSEGGNFTYSKELIALFFGMSNFWDSGAYK